MSSEVSLRMIMRELECLPPESAGYLNRKTSELLIFSDEELSAAEWGDDLQDYPEGQRQQILKAIQVMDSEDYVELPSRYELDDYDIMFGFSSSLDNLDLQDDLLEAIRGKGAPERFRAVIKTRNLEQQWQQYRRNAIREAAVGWLESNGIPFQDDLE
jgi:hypothetical protein